MREQNVVYKNNPKQRKSALFFEQFFLVPWLGKWGGEKRKERDCKNTPLVYLNIMFTKQC